MLKVTPIEDKNTQKHLSELCSVEYNADRMAYQIYEDEKFVGIAEFCIKGKWGYITNLRNAAGVNDVDALEIAGRAVLNFLDLCGIKDVVCEASDKLSKQLAERMTFELDDDGVYRINLEGFFTEPCKRCKKHEA